MATSPPPTSARSYWPIASRTSWRRSRPWTTGARARPAAPPRGLVLVDDVLRLVGRVADLVLDRAARPVDLALVLQAVVAGQRAGGLLDAALGLVCIAVAHRGLLSPGTRMAYPDRPAIQSSPRRPSAIRSPSASNTAWSSSVPGRSSTSTSVSAAGCAP